VLVLFSPPEHPQRLIAGAIAEGAPVNVGGDTTLPVSQESIVHGRCGDVDTMFWTLKSRTTVYPLPARK
jgi:hypothetical protein